MSYNLMYQHSRGNGPMGELACVVFSFATRYEGVTAKMISKILGLPIRFSIAQLETLSIFGFLKPAGKERARPEDTVYVPTGSAFNLE